MRLRVETVADVIFFLARNLLQRVEANVMIGDAEPVCGNERPAAAGIEANAGLLEMVKPLRCRLELIFFFELFQRRRIEKPHPFVGSGGCDKANCARHGK